jgi:hypothetical protein
MEIKKCTKCGIEKELKEFHFRRTENRHNSWCKECLYFLQKARWKDRKRKAIFLLGGKCSRCGYDKSLAALHFHHLDPSKKEFNWDRLRQKTWEDVITELKKCILVCANCHAEIHAPENNGNFTGDNLDNNFINKVIVPTGKCPICEDEVFGTKYCSHKCSQFSSRKVKIRPTKEELILKLAKTSMVAIGKEYNVSDNAVRKWAKQYQIIS